MSQNSLVLATSGTLSGLAAIEGINAALDTVNTLSSGASAPTTPSAGQFWHDTGSNLLKIRSIDNTAWIIVGLLDETNHVFSAATKAAPTIYGLTLSNDAITPNTVIDIAVGGAYDSTAAFYMRLQASFKKNVTTSWASGTGNGALDTGSFQASKFYHVHLIYNASSGAVDVLTSLSYANPALPSGYGYFVALGAIYSNASANIAAFQQVQNEFIYSAQFNDYGAGGAGTMSATAQAVTLTVPTGCKVKAKLRASLLAQTISNNPAICAILISSFDESDQAPTTNGPATLGCDAYNTAVVDAAGDIDLRTNTSGQVRLRSNVTYVNSQIWIFTYGFEYPRGLQ